MKLKARRANKFLTRTYEPAQDVNLDLHTALKSVGAPPVELRLLLYRLL